MSHYELRLTEATAGRLLDGEEAVWTAGEFRVRAVVRPDADAPTVVDRRERGDAPDEEVVALPVEQVEAATDGECVLDHEWALGDPDDDSDGAPTARLAPAESAAKQEPEHTCGAETDDGGTCTRPVSAPGLTCHQHPQDDQDEEDEGGDE